MASNEIRWDSKVFDALTGGADDMQTVFGVEIGDKVTDAGKTVSVYASFRIAGRASTPHEAIALLRKAGDSKVRVSLPKIQGATFRITLRPVYASSTLADVLESMYGEKKKKAPKKADDVPPAIDNPSPGTAAA